MEISIERDCSIMSYQAGWASTNKHAKQQWSCDHSLVRCYRVSFEHIQGKTLFDPWLTTVLKTRPCFQIKRILDWKSWLSNCTLFIIMVAICCGLVNTIGTNGFCTKEHFLTLYQPSISNFSFFTKGLLLLRISIQIRTNPNVRKCSLFQSAPCSCFSQVSGTRSLSSKEKP